MTGSRVQPEVETFILWKEGSWSLNFGRLDNATAEVLLAMDHQFKSRGGRGKD